MNGSVSNVKSRASFTIRSISSSGYSLDITGLVAVSHRSRKRLITSVLRNVEMRIYFGRRWEICCASKRSNLRIKSRVINLQEPVQSVNAYSLPQFIAYLLVVITRVLHVLFLERPVSVIRFFCFSLESLFFLSFPRPSFSHRIMFLFSLNVIFFFPFSRFLTFFCISLLLSAHFCFPNFQSVSFLNFSFLLFIFHNYFYAYASLFLLLSFPLRLFISSSHFFLFVPLFFLLFPRLLSFHIPLLLLSLFLHPFFPYFWFYSYFYFYFLSYFRSASHSPFLFSVNFCIFSSFFV